ncbi:MAG TPA: ISAs1 family transposase, partial [Hyphomicrobiales bacterium]
LGLLRRIALNLIRTDTEKGSIKARIKRAAWNDDYLVKLIRQMR